MSDLKSFDFGKSLWCGRGCYISYFHNIMEFICNVKWFPNKQKNGLNIRPYYTHSYYIFLHANPTIVISIWLF